MSARVLVVEDTPANLKLATLLLRKSGCEVLQARGAEEAIVLAREQQPVLILMDIHLPGMDGLAATRMLRDDPATRDIRVVALTAMAMPGDAQRILAAGCDAYIAKPIRTQAFLAEVMRWLPAPERGP